MQGRGLVPGQGQQAPAAESRARQNAQRYDQGLQV